MFYVRMMSTGKVVNASNVRTISDNGI